MATSPAIIGQRLRAYRLGAGLSAEAVADRLNLSRAAVYRFEKLGINRVETLERVAGLLGVSVASLLGVSAEYNANAITFFERLRQIELEADWLFVVFGPAYLLTSDAYDASLRAILLDDVPNDANNRAEARAAVHELMSILARRKGAFRKRQPAITNVITLADIECLARYGLRRSGIPSSPDEPHRQVAFAELERIARMLQHPAMNVQIGLVRDTLPTTSFSIARKAGGPVLTISPFRLGSEPGVRHGVSIITDAEDAVKLHMRIAQDLWSQALTGERAAQLVRSAIASGRAGTRDGRASGEAGMPG